MSVVLPPLDVRNALPPRGGEGAGPQLLDSSDAADELGQAAAERARRARGLSASSHHVALVWGSKEGGGDYAKRSSAARKGAGRGAAAIAAAEARAAERAEKRRRRAERAAAAERLPPLPQGRGMAPTPPNGRSSTESATRRVDGLKESLAVVQRHQPATMRMLRGLDAFLPHRYANAIRVEFAEEYRVRHRQWHDAQREAPKPEGLAAQHGYRDGPPAGRERRQRMQSARRGHHHLPPIHS